MKIGGFFADGGKEHARSNQHIPCRISKLFFFNTVRRRAHTHNVGGFHHEYYYSLVLVVVPTTTLVSIKSRVCVCVSQSTNRAEKGAHVRLPSRI